jgi:signal peptidase I
MISAFKERRPWAAALVSFVFDPFLGMLYLNRGLIALAYLLVGLVGVISLYRFYGTAYVVPGDYTAWIVYLPLRLVGAVHSYLIARRRPPSESMSWFSRWYALILIYLLFPGAAFAIRSFLYQPFNIASGSMSPTLNIGDYIFVEKFAYNTSGPRRGDVVVFRAPRHENQDWVKRVVGIPGDRVQMLEGKLYINGTVASLRQVENTKVDCYAGDCAQVAQYVETIPGAPEHRIVKRFDNGPPDNAALEIVPAGDYFVLGDNRDNSVDSRNGLGFVPLKAIVGKVSIKWVDGVSHKNVWRTIN